MKLKNILKGNKKEWMFGAVALVLFIVLISYVVVSIQFVVQRLNVVLEKDLTNQELMTTFNFTGIDDLLADKGLIERTFDPEEEQRVQKKESSTTRDMIDEETRVIEPEP
jgi:hypothetical protein